MTHGNGPQVGLSTTLHNEVLAVLTAQTQALIGVRIENALANALKRINKRYNYSIPEVVITEVVVDKSDKAFKNPSKPIGKFYTKADARAAARRGFVIKKLIGGYRRVVASPQPKTIVQRGLIQELLKERKIVIACGGGGVPVIKGPKGLRYAEAVLDKDRTSALIAEEVKADMLIMLTNVDGAYLNFKKKNQRLIGSVVVKELRKYLRDGQFEAGSMKPKVEACVDFVSKTKKKAGIGNLNNPEAVISLKKLTLITP